MIERLGSLVCAQATERSLYISGAGYLFLCARCAGIYTGFFTGATYLFVSRGKSLKELPAPTILVICVFFLVLLIFDSLGSRFGLWASAKYTRLFLGLFGGASLSLFLVPVFNFALFTGPDKNSGLRTLSEYAVFLIFPAAVWLIMSRTYSFLYLPVSYASFAGVVMIFLMLNISVAAAITGRERLKNKSGIILLAGIVLVLTSIEVLILEIF